MEERGKEGRKRRGKLYSRRRTKPETVENRKDGSERFSIFLSKKKN